MAPAPGELEVGRIGRAHGLRGEVSITFVSNRPERAAPGAVLHAGDRVLVIAAARQHQGKWLVQFEGVDDRSSAEALRGTILTAEPLTATAQLDDGEFWVHELIGSPVVDTAGNALWAASSASRRTPRTISWCSTPMRWCRWCSSSNASTTSSSSTRPPASSSSDARRRLHDLHGVLRGPARARRCSVEHASRDCSTCGCTTHATSRPAITAASTTRRSAGERAWS